MGCFKGTLIALVCLLFIFASNPGRKKFTVRMDCFSSWGFPYIYKLTERGLYIYADSQVNPAFTAFKEVYMKALSSHESDSIYHYLRTVPYDTLQHVYERRLLDGSMIRVNISGYKLKSRQIELYNTTTDITSDFYHLIKRWIPESEEQLRNRLQ